VAGSLSIPASCGMILDRPLVRRTPVNEPAVSTHVIRMCSAGTKKPAISHRARNSGSKDGDSIGILKRNHKREVVSPNMS
jgi:hypothetical protein